MIPIYIVYAIILVKIIFIGLAIWSKMLINELKRKKLTGQEKKSLESRLANINYWKDRLEFIFIGTMSCIMLYIFNPLKSGNSSIVLSREERILLFALGIILLITANWKIFIGNSVVLKYIQDVIAN